MFLIFSSIRVMFSVGLFSYMRAATSPAAHQYLRRMEALAAANDSEAIINEGLAIYEMAKSFPQLQNLSDIPSLPADAKVWSGDYSTYEWLGKRKLSDFDEEIGNNSVHRSLFTTQPPWCSYFGVTCGNAVGTYEYASVIEIFLDSLSLYGTLADSIGNFRSITTFSMGSNYVSGTIPSTIGGWKNSIDRILLFQNILEGSIPEVLTTCTKLTDLQLNENYFYGSIPNSLGTLSSMSVLQLFTNNLNGTIPSSLGNLNKLDRLRLEKNLLTGTIPNSLTQLTVVDLLHLSTNYLSGTIPSGINALTKMSHLLLQKNKLTGTLPFMADLADLFELDVHSNFLTMGTKTEVDPGIFSDLTLEGPMNLSSNCLTFPSKNFYATGCDKKVPTRQPTSGVPNMPPSPPPTGAPSIELGQPSAQSFQPTRTTNATNANAASVFERKKDSMSPFNNEGSTDYFIVGIIIGTAGVVGAAYMVFMKTCILKV